MKLVDQLKINSSDTISILVPEYTYKYNYFYKPTKCLHIYDQITVVLEQKNKKILLSKNMMDNIYENFLSVLRGILSGEHILSAHIEVGCVGIVYNMDVMSDNDEFYDIAPFSLCNNADSITVMYLKDNKIYLEIFPLYPWLYEDSNAGEKYISFGEYMKTYKAIALYEISKETAQKWLNQCEKIMETVDRSTIHSQA